MASRMATGMKKREEVVEPLHKCCKVGLVDMIVDEFLKKWDDSVVDWLVRLV